MVQQEAVKAAEKQREMWREAEQQGAQESLGLCAPDLGAAGAVRSGAFHELQSSGGDAHEDLSAVW